MKKAERIEFVHQSMETGELGRVMIMTQNAATRANNVLRNFGTPYRWVRKANVNIGQVAR